MAECTMRYVDMTAELAAPCPVEVLFAEVEDLDAYAEWLAIVARTERADRDDGDAGPAWHVELRGRIGPLARSKRLRMVRTEHEPPHRVRFERRELDGRQHSPWVLDVVVSATAQGSRLEMALHYGGRFGGELLERLLRDEIDASRARLLARLPVTERGD